MNNNGIDKIKEMVHSPLNWKHYNETLVRDETNCYAHAIGSMYPSKGLYRIGNLSGKRKESQELLSKEQVKSLFLKDMEFLNLGCQEMEFSSMDDLFDKIYSMNLSNNQYVVLLFLYFYNDGTIFDFHFWRYDRSVGFSHKRYDQMPIIIENPRMDWPEKWNVKCIGAFCITR